MLKKFTLVLAALLLCAGLNAQTYSGGVKGTVINRSSKMPVQGAALSLYQGTSQIASGTTDSEGNFLIENLKDGMYDLLITAADFAPARVNVTVNDGYVKNMFTISLSPQVVVNEVDDSSFGEFDMEDSGYSDNPTILYGQNDVFNDITSFSFSAIRFKARGFNSESQDVYLAGVKLNDAITGYSPYSLWSGLNEATRTKFSVTGNQVSDYGFGGYNGLVNIPANAVNVRKGWRASAMTNSLLYRTRFMLSYASGELDNGWSYAFNLSARLGGNDWIKGVYYRSFGYYMSVEKRFTPASRLGLTFMGTPGRRGAQNASTQEVYDLMGNNMYNSNWGYQNGQIRNSRERRTHEPIAILKYDYTPSDKFKASLTALYRFGKNGYTALDWYDSADPRPDYYRNLPSYFYMENSDYNRNNYAKYLWAKHVWENGLREYVHLNWDKFYDVNKNNWDAYGRRSKYIIEERRVDQNDLHFAGNLMWKMTNFWTITLGAKYRYNHTENYKKVADLLGGDYYLNIDNFAERDYASSPALIQNDLNYYLLHGEAQVLRKGDKFGYDYYSEVREAESWMNWKLNFGGFEANLAGEIGYTKFWRNGRYRKGLFAGLDNEGDPIYFRDQLITSYDSEGKPITSFGKSEKPHFTTWGAKANLSYSFLGGHRIEATGGFYTKAPTFNKAFVSPRTRNTLIPYLEKTKIFSADASYMYTNASTAFKLTGFFTTIKDQTDVMSFYDDSQNSYTNFAMRGIDQRHIGFELGFKVPTPITNLSFEGAVTYGEYIYTSNPTMTQTVDNSTKIIYQDEIIPYWMSHPVFRQDESGNYIVGDDGQYVVKKYKKHYIPATPQLAASAGLSYFYNYWFIDANVNYFDRSYLGMNPLYRTDMATAGPDGIVTPSEIQYMAAQEKLFSNEFIVNLSVGKSWYIQRKYQLGFNVSINNILNNKNVKTGGYEQTRLVDNTTSKERYYRFDPKYFYMAGLNYMVNLYVRF